MRGQGPVPWGTGPCSSSPGNDSHGFGTEIFQFNCLFEVPRQGDHPLVSSSVLVHHGDNEIQSKWLQTAIPVELFAFPYKTSSSWLLFVQVVQACSSFWTTHSCFFHPPPILRLCYIMNFIYLCYWEMLSLQLSPAFCFQAHFFPHVARQY